jgi:hypothetical protein
VPPGNPAGVFNSGVNPLEIGGNRGHNLPSVTNKDIAGQTFSSVRIEKPWGRIFSSVPN